GHIHERREALRIGPEILLSEDEWPMGGKAAMELHDPRARRVWNVRYGLHEPVHAILDVTRPTFQESVPVGSQNVGPRQVEKKPVMITWAKGPVGNDVGDEAVEPITTELSFILL